MALARLFTLTPAWAQSCHARRDRLELRTRPACADDATFAALVDKGMTPGAVADVDPDGQMRIIDDWQTHPDGSR